jgi:hypothetical protein
LKPPREGCGDPRIRGKNKKTSREKEVRKPGRPPDNTAVVKHRMLSSIMTIHKQKTYKCAITASSVYPKDSQFPPGGQGLLGKIYY